MKVRIECNKEDYGKVKKMFEDNGYTISNDSKFIFIEVGYKTETITAFDLSGDKFIINLSDIILIETSDYKNIVKTIDGSEFYTQDKLYYFESEHFQHMLIRVNKSQIINFKHIKKVSLMINSRLKLTMTTNETVYVTRTYLRTFKEKFN